MNYEELNNFTWDEISDLTFGDVKLDVKELLNKIQNCDSQIPYGVVLKLQELCGYLNDANIEVEGKEQISKNHIPTTICGIAGFLATVTTLITDGPEAFEKIKDSLLSILEELAKIL